MPRSYTQNRPFTGRLCVSRRVLLAVIDRNVWDVLDVLLVREAQASSDEVDDTEDRYHGNEAHDSVEHELATSLTVAVIITTHDEVLEHSVDEHQEGGSEDQRNQRTVDE